MKAVGLTRIQVMDKRSGHPTGAVFGSPEWCTQWLLEDQKEDFTVLCKHLSRGIEIDTFKKPDWGYLTNAVVTPFGGRKEEG